MCCAITEVLRRDCCRVTEATIECFVEMAFSLNRPLGLMMPTGLEAGAVGSSTSSHPHNVVSNRNDAAFQCVQQR